MVAGNNIDCASFFQAALREVVVGVVFVHRNVAPTRAYGAPNGFLAVGAVNAAARGCAR
jgi:hypothetical protein